MAHAFRLTPDEADDAAQATWLLLVGHVGTLRDPDRVGGWLKVTMQRTCIGIVRQRKREQLAGDLGDWQVVASGPSVEAELLRAERDATIWQAVDRLPRKQRQLLRALFAPSDPSYEEVSAELSIPIGGIGPTRGRALRRLQQVLHDAAVRPDDLHDEPRSHSLFAGARFSPADCVASG